MKWTDFLLVVLCFAVTLAGMAESGKYDDDDDDDDDHKDNDADKYDDNDGQPDYCPKDNGMFANPTDCASFYNCVDGEAILQTCAPGLLFDPKKKLCNFPNQVKCKNECRGPNGLFPSQHRCDEFVLCTDNKPQVKRCKKGLWFDANLQVCNYKSQVLCSLPKGPKKGKRTTTTAKPYKKSRSKNDDDDDDEDDGSYRDNSSSRKKRKSQVKVGQYVSGDNLFTIHGRGVQKGQAELAAASVKSVCPKARGLFPHPDDCSRFYQCYDGEVLIKTCPSGLLFDEHRHMCAFSREVDCGGRVYRAAPYLGGP